MRKYEYKALGNGLFNMSNEHIEEMLNEYGKDGWKVIATIENEGFTFKVILMREN